MLKWLHKLFINPSKDKYEDEIKSSFAFLFENYGFSFSKCDLGNAVDKNGNFVFYSPLNAYFIYNDRLCINVLYLVQRQEWTAYITDEHREDQIYIQNGDAIHEHFYAYGFNTFAAEIKAQLNSTGTIFGRKI